MPRFPVLVFLRFFASQFLAFNALFVLCTAFFLHSQGLGLAEFWPFAAAFAILSAALSAFTSWRFTRPIRRALQKALRIASKKYAQVTGATDEKEIFEDDPGEYSELVSALERIDKKLKKRKEQLLREREENAAFMSSVQEGLLSVDPAGKIRYFNTQFAILFLPPDFVRSEEALHLADAFRVPEIFEAFRRVLESGQTQKVQLRLLTQLDNQYRDFSVSMTPLRTEGSDEIRGVIGIFHDVSDLKKVERIRIDFVGNASHELRTPLTSIKGYLDTLKDDFRSGRLDQADKFLSIISRNVDRLIELVNDLLSLSAMEHNSDLRLEHVSAMAISEHVINDLTGLASEKGQMIRVSGDVPPFYADVRKIEQVIRNLVSNAIKYVPEGQQIHIRWDLSERGEIILKIIDNGPGIPEEHHARLFERFYRIDKGRSRDAGGTGLGLAIVKHIMQSHGGSVSVKSQLGVGSEFICVFPLLKETSPT